MQRFILFKKKLLNSQQKLMQLLKTSSSNVIRNSVVDPIKVEFVEPTVFIKEELQDETADLIDDSDIKLDNHRRNLARFSVPTCLFPQVQRSFPCYQCDEVFSNESKVRQHAEIAHTALDDDDMELPWEVETLHPTHSAVNSTRTKSLNGSSRKLSSKLSKERLSP